MNIKDFKEELKHDYKILVNCNDAKALDDATYHLSNIIDREQLDPELERIKREEF